jgi:hypothetical protein
MRGERYIWKKRLNKKEQGLDDFEKSLPLQMTKDAKIKTIWSREKVEVEDDCTFCC